MPFDEDIQKLRNLSNSLNSNSALHKILEEVISCRTKVIGEVIEKNDKMKGGGYAVRLYTVDEKIKDPKIKDYKMKGYKVYYQGGNLGNLVHELTHVAVNEAYGQDFVNYMSKASKNLDPLFKEGTQWHYLANEEDLQAKWMDDGQNKSLLEELSGLITLADKIPDRKEKEKVTTQLGYGKRAVYIEHDTVINQILVWLHEWKYSESPAIQKKNLYKAVENSAKKAYDLRQAAYTHRSSGNPTSVGERNDSYRSGNALYAATNAATSFADRHEV